MLQNFPTSITAGISLKREIVLEDYPSADWELRAILRGPSQIDLLATAAGAGHVFAETAAITGTWSAGLYAVSLRVLSGDDVHEIESGQVTVADDLVAITESHDPRGHAQRTLTAIEAVIEGRASKDQQSYTINGRTLVRTAISDLLLLKKEYQKAAEKAGPGGARSKRLLGRQVKVRFGR